MSKKSLLATILCLILFSIKGMAQVPEDTDFRILSPYDSVCREEIVQYLAEIKKHRPTVAVVLSGGGAKGAAHVGVLKELEKYGIPIDLIMGTSMGGLMGALYALGHTPEELIDQYAGIHWDLVMNDRIPYQMRTYADRELRKEYQMNIVFEKDLAKDLQLGRVHGMQVNNLFSSLSVGYQDSTSFAKLPIPYICMATDVITGKEKAWYGGKITQAMRSTMAIPGVFAPVKVGDMLLLDGGMMNNMPADLAKDLGVDYIICVSLGDTSHTDSEYYHLGRFGFRLFTLGWARKYKKNYELPDISIFPNTDGFGMLSFTREAIDTLLNRGATAAKSFDKEFKDLKAKVGSDTPHLNDHPAQQVITKSVAIDGFEINGVTGTEYNIVKKMSKLEGVNKIGGERLAEIATKLYSTKAFDMVGYEFSGHQEPYKFILNCEKGPQNQYCFGFRIDSEEIISLDAAYGWHTRTLFGPSAMVSGKLGINPNIKGKVSYRFPNGPVLNASAMVKWVNMNRVLTFSESDASYNYTNLRQEVFLSESFTSPVAYKIGIRNNWFKMKGITVFDSDTDTNTDSEAEVEAEETAIGINNEVLVEKYKEDMVSLFANVKRETFDDPYFPTKGYKVGAGYEWIFYNNKEDSKHHIITATASAAASFGDHFTIAPTVDLRGVSGNANTLLSNIIGGTMYGRYIDQQIPFVGVNGIYELFDYTGVARLDLRYRFKKSHYLSLIANGFLSTTSLDKSAEARLTEKGYGFGVEYAYRTVAGPIRLQVGKSNVVKGMSVYVGVGLDF